MNVYDFDNTIYNGETVVDFYLFCLRKNLSLIKYFPVTLNMLIRYKLGKVSLDELETKAIKYVSDIFLHIKDLHSVVSEFWDLHEHKIKPFYLKNQHPDDVVVSASCDFLLNEICKRLKISYCLCSQIDINTGKILRICYHTNKPEIFRKHFPNENIDSFYTDSMTDIPMIKLADSAYLVKGNKIIKIRKEDIK